MTHVLKMLEDPTMAFTNVQNFIRSELDIDVKGCWGYTPLIYASHLGYYEICKLLIENGANINARDDHGKTPLIHAAMSLRKEICKLLVENGADVNARDRYGSTPLIYTAMSHENKRKCKEICKLLIVNGADINAKDFHRGYTPLLGGALIGNDDACEFLIANGADVNIVGSWNDIEDEYSGYTPLIFV